MIWIPSKIKNNTCQRLEEPLVSQQSSILSAPIVTVDSSCSWVTIFGDWWQDLHPGHHKTLHSAKHTKSKKKPENLFRGSTDVQLPFAGQLNG